MNTRQLIIDELEQRMNDIETVKTVTVWKMTDFAPAEYPVISIKDTIDNMPTDGVIGKIDHELSIELNALFFGATSVKDVREMITSVVAAIGRDGTFDSLAYNTVINSAELDIDEAGKLQATALIDITIYYRSDIWTI